MIAWIIRRPDPRMRYWLLQLAMPLALAHRMIFALIHAPHFLIDPDYYHGFFYVYRGFILDAIECIEELRR
jgi:hypothetical protein